MGSILAPFMVIMNPTRLSRTMNTNKAEKRANTERVAGTISRCLEHFFQEISPQERGIRLEVECRGQTGYQEGEGVISALVFHRPDGGAPMEGYVGVSNGGGNVYDVVVAFIDGEEQAFSIGIPDPAMEAEAVQPLVKGVCHYLLMELERIAGEQALRLATAEQAPADMQANAREARAIASLCEYLEGVVALILSSEAAHEDGLPYRDRGLLQPTQRPPQASQSPRHLRALNLRHHLRS